MAVQCPCGIVLPLSRSSRYKLSHWLHPFFVFKRMTRNSNALSLKCIIDSCACYALLLTTTYFCFNSQRVMCCTWYILVRFEPRERDKVKLWHRCVVAYLLISSVISFWLLFLQSPPPLLLHILCPLVRFFARQMFVQTYCTLVNDQEVWLPETKSLSLPYPGTNLWSSPRKLWYRLIL